MFLVGSVVLILLGVALVAILGKSTPSGSSSDVRARATSKQALSVLGSVVAVDETKGSVQVENVQFADASRSGSTQNLGAWVITAPSGFNFASVSPGMRVTIGVDAPTFQVTTRTMTALTIVLAK